MSLRAASSGSPNPPRGRSKFLRFRRAALRSRRAPPPFAGCAEGKAVTLDINHDGKQVGSVSAGSGVDVIAFSPTLGHLYVPGASSATMAIVGVAASGELSVLGTVPTADGAHCVVADD